MKKVRIESKSQALKKQTETMRIMKYSCAKFLWSGSAKNYFNKEESVLDNVQALWIERREDRDGAYAVLMCLTEK